MGMALSAKYLDKLAYRTRVVLGESEMAEGPQWEAIALAAYCGLDNSELISPDGEVSNSTRSEYYEDGHPDRFFEMYIAEQNIAGAALGLSMRGKLPFFSSFAAFLTRAFDQIRMARYSEPNLKLVG
jgi:transketolase C-terminal domain/subunit